MKRAWRGGRTPLWRLLLVVAAVSTLGSGPSIGFRAGDPKRTDSGATSSVGAALRRGGFMNFQLSPHCMRAIVAVTIACSQVGPAGLAGCGVVLHQTQGSCP